MYQHFGKSLKGAGRKRNEDRWLARPLGDTGLLLAVADGIGGHHGGDVAAQMIIDCLASLQYQTGNNIARKFEYALHNADDAITKKIEQQPILRGMGATSTTAHIEGNRVTWTHIGDSRLYLLRGTLLKQVTSDHTYVQHLVDRGELSDEQAANHPLAHVLEQCIGAIDAGIDSGTFAVKGGDYLILCSDGTYKAFSEDRLISLFTSGLSLPELVDRLLQTVSQTANHDDATVIVVQIA